MFEKLKEKYVDELLQTHAFLVKSVDETPFTLRSGKKSYIFLDHARVTTSPSAYKAFVDIIAYLTQMIYQKQKIILCNVDSKISAQLVGSVAYKLSLPQLIYKSKELTSIEKGTNTQLTGDSKWNMPVAILDDVMTGGDGTAKNVADLILANFDKIKDIQIFVGFIREPRESTYTTHYALTRGELIEIMWDTLSPEQKQAVDKERNMV